jgi:hypothetical protein
MEEQLQPKEYPLRRYSVTIAVESNPPMPGKNKYIVWNSATSVFDEYPIKLSETQIGNFLEMIVVPPIRRAGFLSYKKRIIQVSINDLLRNHVNVTKFYTTPNTQPNTGSGTPVGSIPPADTIQRGTKTSSGDELDQESSIYWKEQMQSLYNSEDPEEEWDLETATQSR